VVRLMPDYLDPISPCAQPLLPLDTAPRAAHAVDAVPGRVHTFHLREFHWWFLDLHATYHAVWHTGATCFTLGSVRRFWRGLFCENERGAVADVLRVSLRSGTHHRACYRIVQVWDILSKTRLSPWTFGWFWFWSV